MKIAFLSAILTVIFLSSSVVAQISDENVDDAYVQQIVTANNTEALNKLIAAGLDVNSYDKNGNTLLFFTLTNNIDLTMAKRLIQAGADVNLPSQNGMTPLIIATSLASALDMHNNQAPQTNIEKAIQNQQRIFQLQHAQEMAKMLIESGADVNQETPFGTPLMSASTNDANVQIVSLLLEADAKVNQTDRNGRTALFYAAAFGAEEITPILIKAGADINHLDAYGKNYMDVDKNTLLGK